MNKRQVFLSILFMGILASYSYCQEGMIGEVRLFAGNFAPRGWAFCHGQLLPISQNSALFSILGTTYGGDGRSTFALPDLRGRAPIGAGKGPGLSDQRLGKKLGNEKINVPLVKTKINSSRLSPKDRKKGTVVVYSAKAMTNMQPILAINYIICTQGVFPSRH